ncbi:hypothetical protein [Marinobacter sp.]|uniref:hypothetical protein n=1 Tax=Marinobacter sp. TaxID=50741 RepID=UPI0035C759C9
MPVNTLSPDTSDQLFKDNAHARQHYLHSETVNGTGEWLIIPAGLEEVFVSVEPSAGSARVEYTQAPVSDLDAGSPAAKPWDHGDVTAYKGSVMPAVVTAIRCFSTAPTTFKVTA